MQANRSRLWIACLTLPLAIIVLASSAGATPSASAHPKTNVTHNTVANCALKLNGTVANKVVISKQTRANGQSLTSVRAGCNSYIFVGTAGMSYSYSATGATIITPNTKTSGSVVGISVSTVYANAIAVGFSKAQADEMVAQTAITTAGAAISAPSSKATVSTARSTKSSLSSSASATIIATPCASIKSANGGQATGRACDIMTLVQRSGENWYIGDSITASGHNGTWWNNLTKLNASDNYVKGNSVVEWQPSGFVNTGSCQTYNESIGWNGIGIGSTQTVCPSGLGPEWANPTTGSGAQWTGCSTNTQSAPAVDVIHSPPNASDAMYVRINLAWAWC